MSNACTHALRSNIGVIVSESFIRTWFALQRQLISGLQIAYVDLQGAGVQPGGYPG